MSGSLALGSSSRLRLTRGGEGASRTPRSARWLVLFFLPSYRASFLLPLPSSMVMVIFFMVAVLMVVALVGLLLWLFFLREG